MKISNLADILNATFINQEDFSREIKGGYTCDMLSRVVSGIGESQAWVTILNSVNVIAVASLTDCPCVILADGVEMDEGVALKAKNKGINVITTTYSAYEVCGIIYSALGSDEKS